MTLLSFALAVLSPVPALVPLPQQVEWRTGAFAIGRSTVLNAQGLPAHLTAELRRTVGQPLRPGTTLSNAIRIERVSGLPREGYRLEVGANGVRIGASDDAGVFYAIKTLGQLRDGGKIAACKIEDAPRFAWRGLMLDESRHFFGAKYVRRFIDNLAAHKLNSFHWHLTDDGGWRMQVRSMPELTDIGAWRRDQGVEWDYANLNFPGRRTGERLYGGFYTQKELRAMVRYAQERNVNIVPEIEMPGHALAATSARPEIRCTPPAGVMEAWLRDTRSTGPTMMCPGKDATIDFCKRVLDETMDVFPSKFIHIGGDEVDKGLWRQCRDCQARMKANGLKDVEELQSWFIHQIDAYLASKGRRLIGWDEILEGGLAPGATVMSWRGIQGGIAAAKAGHDVVMSPTSHCYFDYSYDSIPTSLVYGYEPIPAVLAGDETSRVLGAQGNIWTEWLSSPAEVDAMAYPRAAALAETLWTLPDRKNWEDFSERLNGHYARMAGMGILFRLPPPRLVPDVVNLAATDRFEVSGVPIGGARLVDEAGRPISGGVVPARAGETKIYFQLAGGRKSEPAVGRALRLVPNSPAATPGLLRAVMPWTGNLAPAPKDFAGAERVRVAAPTLQGVAKDRPFAALFEGALVVSRAGRYTLGIASDDGSVLYMNGEKILDNDGLHGNRERTVTVDLQVGAYPVQLTYFDAGGASTLGMFWTPPGGVREAVMAFRG